MTRSCLAALALTLAPFSATGQEAVMTPFEGSFDDAAFAVENAIIGKGLVIDFTSHVGEMLARTSEDVGGERELFDEADIFLFCSAVTSREVMEADVMNIVHCPYGVIVAERDGKVMIGHRSYPDGPMQAVETMLNEIVTEATGG